MQPLPEDVLADARAILDTVIRPELPDGFAREQAGLLSNLLEHVRLRTTLEFAALVEDCRDMRAVLGPLAPEAVAAVPDPAATAVDLTVLRAEAQALRRVLSAAVDAAESSDDPTLGPIRDLLRRQLDRDRTMIGPGYPRGT